MFNKKQAWRTIHVYPYLNSNFAPACFNPINPIISHSCFWCIRRTFLLVGPAIKRGELQLFKAPYSSNLSSQIYKSHSLSHIQHCVFTFPRVGKLVYIIPTIQPWTVFQNLIHHLGAVFLFCKHLEECTCFIIQHPKRWMKWVIVNSLLKVGGFIWVLSLKHSWHYISSPHNSNRITFSATDSQGLILFLKFLIKRLILVCPFIPA